MIDDLVVRKAETFREKQNIEVLVGHRALSIDGRGRVLAVAAQGGQPRSIPYDRLLIATGARPVVPDRPGFELEGVMTLKSLEDGRNIKSFLDSGRVHNAVIIGMGYIALEMCEALRGRGVTVTMVKPRSTLLPWMPGELSSAVRHELERNQVQVQTGFSIDRIEREGRNLRVVGSDAAFTADLVLTAVGVQPNSELAVQAGLDLGPGRAIAVDRSLRTSDPAIYAAGDCADAFHVVTGARTWIPLALRANRAGWAVADHVCGRAVELPGVVGSAVFKVFSLEVARTGVTISEAGQAGFEPVQVIIESGSRAHSHPGSVSIKVHMVGDKKSGRLLGVQMVGQEGVAHRINSVAVALHAGMTVDQFLQCDLAYAPPFGPSWDPLLTAANQLVKLL